MNDQTPAVPSAEKAMLDDLARSGLAPSDMQCHLLTNPERARTQVGFSVQGYVIPYFDMEGKPVQHFRTRLFDNDPKYKQPKESANFVYFPPSFSRVLKTSTKPYVLLVEGEKKAALACKLGYPCVAIGGVDSWRTRTFVLPTGAEVTNKGKDAISIKLPSHTVMHESSNSPYATGLQDLNSYLRDTGKTIFICFDTDGAGVKEPVQVAAASLGFEFRATGIPYKNIRQLILPNPDGLEKIGLDDFLVSYGAVNLDKVIAVNMAKRAAFPRHPSMIEYLNKKLKSRRKIDRPELKKIAIAVVSELDSSGVRLRSTNEQETFYFDYKTHKLMSVDLSSKSGRLDGSAFGRYYYEHFGLGSPDTDLNHWVNTMFTGEEPVEDVDPHRVIARRDFTEDSVIFQLGDGRFIRIDGAKPEDSDKIGLPGVQVYNNGDRGILFAENQMKEPDVQSLLDNYEWFNKESPPGTNMPFWWGQVLNDVRLRDRDKQRVLTALLYYISPWLYRWRGTQLPLEMVLGEAGSGKSTLCALRLAILTGDARLRNAPSDLRDWHASLHNTGGLHVTDNVVLRDQTLRQKLSDSICRIVTELEPRIEARKLYTDAELYLIPVKAVFVITALIQPFTSQDVLQRSYIVDLDKTQNVGNDGLSFDSFWMEHQLAKFGGREAWLAHHLLVLHRFFELVKKKWVVSYSAKHRLINFEQALKLMAEVFGINGDWIPDYLTKSSTRSIIESDHAYEGLRAWADLVRTFKDQSRLYIARDIAEWMQSSDDYAKNEMLTNPRKLGRYIVQHKSELQEHAGIHYAGTLNNAQRYRVRPVKE